MNIEPHLRTQYHQMLMIEVEEATTPRIHRGDSESTRI